MRIATRNAPDWEKLYRTAHKNEMELGHELSLARRDMAALEEQLQGPDGRQNMWWVQCKVLRQKTALRRLEARNASLRFAMTVTRRLRGEITAEEWRKAKAEIQYEQLRDQIDTYEMFMQEMPSQVS